MYSYLVGPRDKYCFTEYNSVHCSGYRSFHRPTTSVIKYFDFAFQRLDIPLTQLASFLILLDLGLVD